MQRVIGLTGPVAAGKDEVAKILARNRVVVIDADKLAHTLYSPQLPLWSAIVKEFGSKILKRGGEINRQKLAQLVFADKKQLEKLNRIVHPELKQVVIREIENRKSTIENRTIVVNAAVLAEIGLVDCVDEVWVVLAPKRQRLARLLKAGLKKNEALNRINCQMSEKEYRELADKLVINNSTLKGLKTKVLHILREVKRDE